MTRRPRNRAASGVLAALLGLLLLTSGLGTWSEWRGQERLDPGTITAGSVSLTPGTTTVQLLSRQPVGTRTYASVTTCPATAPYVECRVVTATIADERLIPGDTLRVARTVTIATNGTNLKGDLTFDASALLNESGSSLGGVTSTALSVTTPTNQILSGTTTVTRPIRRSTTGDFGTYTAVALLATPVDNAGARWDSSLFNQPLDLGAFAITFTQTN